MMWGKTYEHKLDEVKFVEEESGDLMQTSNSLSSNLIWEDRVIIFLMTLNLWVEFGQDECEA